VTEEPAFVYRLSGSNQFPSLGGLCSCNWRRLWRLHDIRLDRRYFHLKPFRKGTNAFVPAYR
jgi:hypothetical protein